jgi:hypothetical protein
VIDLQQRPTEQIKGRTSNKLRALSQGWLSEPACDLMNNLEVEFGLKSKTIPIGVAKYQLQGALPARLRGKPLEDAIRGAMPGSR